MSKNSHQNNSSIYLSLSLTHTHTHTHTISKSGVCQSKLTNVYQLDEKKWPQKVSRLRTRVGSTDTVYRSVTVTIEIIYLYFGDTTSLPKCSKTRDSKMAVDWGNCVGHTGHANFGWNKCQFCIVYVYINMAVRWSISSPDYFQQYRSSTS
jgi:hypothetical protein